MRLNLRSAILLVAMMFSASLIAHGGPELHIEEEVFDFGVVYEGDVVVFAFLLENTGDELLIIESVGASCGCTATDLTDREIEPGEVERLGGTFDTSGLGGMRTSKTVYVSSNDPSRPDVTLRITGRVVEDEVFLVEAKDLSGDLMFLIDVRDPSAYAEGHLPGAVNLPVGSAELWMEILPQDVRIVLCDRDGQSSVAIAQEMLALGFMRVEVLLGGLDEWTRLYGDRMLVSFPLTIAPAMLEQAEE